MAGYGHNSGDLDGKWLAKRHSQMKAARSALDTHCQEIAQLVLPMMALFQQQGYTHQQGEKRTQKLMESTAPLALTRYASAVEGFLTPHGERWSILTTNNKALNKSQRVKIFFDEANDLLFDTRYDPRAGFQNQVHACLMGQGAFGTAGLFCDGSIRRSHAGGMLFGTQYTSFSLVNIYVSTDSAGHVDTVHREWRQTARNCIADFGKDCPEEIVAAADRDPDQEFTIVHIVMPNPTRVNGSLGPKGMAFASYYLWLEKSHVIQRGGYRTLRYAIARGMSAPGEHYGRSAAMDVLAEIKTINELRRKMLRQQDMALNPTTLIHSEMGTNLDLRPGKAIGGMVSQEGKPLAIPYNTGASFIPAENEMARIREVINDAFLINLFQVLVQRPGQPTAYEVAQRAKEKAQLIAPLIGRLQSEFLGTIIENEMDILADYGALPELPPELIEAQGEYQITYKSDITRSLEQGEIMAYREFMNDVAVMMEFNPEILEVVDHMGIARDAAEKRGIPTKRIRTEEQLAEIRKQNAQAKQQMQVLPAAQQIADIQATDAKAAATRKVA